MHTDECELVKICLCTCSHYSQYSQLWQFVKRDKTTEMGMLNAWSHSLGLIRMDLHNLISDIFNGLCSLIHDSDSIHLNSSWFSQINLTSHWAWRPASCSVSVHCMQWSGKCKPFCKCATQHGSTGQSLAVANKATFWNCFVMMRPKTRIEDLPMTHDITVHLHNEYVAWIEKLKSDIKVHWS